MAAKAGNNDATPAQPEQPSFEENLTRLEEIVSELERGNLPLDKALRLYEEAVGAYRTCHSLLQQAEGKIVKLVETLEGELREERFEAGEDDGDEGE